MKKTDLNFKDAHDENGIPICCMTCAYWAFKDGRKCEVKDPTAPCKSWEISIYYKGGKQ